MRRQSFSKTSGQSGLEERLDAVSEQLKRLQLVESSSIGVHQNTHGTALRIKRIPPGTVEGAPIEIKRLKVTAVLDDTLTCTGLDGADVGTEFVVAKPFRLRKTPFHNKTIGGRAYVYQSATNRTVRVGTILEAQEIIPLFNLNFDEIHVIDATGISGLAGVKWIDLNTDGRAWARI